MALTRREVLKLAVGSLLPAVPASLTASDLPKRTLGKMGWKTSLYAVGTAELPSDDEAIRALNEALDGGVNYIDTAPSYMATRSESILGRVLPARRKDVFLATKTLERSSDGAYDEVRSSLSRLKIKHIDLLQVHAVNDMATLDSVLASAGTIKGLERAKKEGLIRHIGITGHTRPEVILSAIQRYPFDSILIPISALDRHISDFNMEVVPAANKLGIAVCGMKALKGIERATGGKFQASEYIRYSASQEVSNLVIGLRRQSEVKENLALFRDFKKMTAAEARALEASSKTYADVGHLWWKKKS